jgi:membrane protein
MYIRFQDDNVSSLSAQLSLFLLLALFPFILFMLNLLSFTSIPSGSFIGNIAEFLPAEVGKLLRQTVSEIIGAKSTGLLSVGAVVTIWSASRGVSAVSFALNKAYDKQEDRPFWKVAIIMMVFTVAIAVIVVAALLFLIFGEVLARDIFSCLDGAETFTRLWRLLRYIVPLVLMLLLFSLLYKFVPNCKLRLKHVLPGAIVASFGWAAASFVFSLYVNDFSTYTRIYGSIGGIIILLLWLYLSSMIVILGGEINATLHYFRTGQYIDKYEIKRLQLPGFLRRLKRKHPPG